MKLSLPKVNQFHSKNQFEIISNGKRIFQSYNSIIAVIDQKGNVTLDTNYWDYSTTTGKYRNLFLGDKSKKETQRKIDSGLYALDNLN